MTEHMSPIPSRLYNAAVGGHVAGADQIIDDNTGLTLDKVAGGALEEKTYTSGSNNGMGRVVLRKNLVEGVNTLTQSMINKNNTIYVIQYDFTLGEDITIPNNCVLQFEGGSISNNANYTLSINDLAFTIDAPIGVKIFDNIRFVNRHPRIIHTSWWGISEGVQSDNDFEYVLNLGKDGYKLKIIVDNEIQLSRAIEAKCVNTEISGISNGGTNKQLGSMPRIFSTMTPTSTTQALITLHTQETSINGIFFAWLSVPNDGSYSGQNAIIELFPQYLGTSGHASDDIDTAITGCGFRAASANNLTFYCNMIKAHGRGLLVDSCGFSGVFGPNDSSANEGVICCITMKQDGSGDVGSAPADQMRRITITNNFFHTGYMQYAVRLKQGSDDEDATFKGFVFSNNMLDTGTAGVLSTAKMSGARIENNTFLFLRKNIFTIERGTSSNHDGGSINGIIISGNVVSISGNDMTQSSYWQRCKLFYAQVRKGRYIKNVLIANNTMSRVNIGTAIIDLSCYSNEGENIEFSGINVIGNNIVDQISTPDTGSSTNYKLLVSINTNLLPATVKNINVIGNIVEDRNEVAYTPYAFAHLNQTNSTTSHIRVFYNNFIDKAFMNSSSEIESWTDVKTDDNT